jgi:hypothetical protein
MLNSILWNISFFLLFFIASSSLHSYLFHFFLQCEKELNAFIYNTIAEAAADDAAVENFLHILRKKFFCIAFFGRREIFRYEFIELEYLEFAIVRY